MWTNNNSESLNHVLKQVIDWKSQPLLDILNILTKIIETQFKDMKRALVNTGEYRLCANHKQSSMTKTAWVGKIDEERWKLYRRLRLYIANDKAVFSEIISIGGKNGQIGGKKYIGEGSGGRLRPPVGPGIKRFSILGPFFLASQTI
jgi:hypothetical protein